MIFKTDPLPIAPRVPEPGDFFIDGEGDLNLVTGDGAVVCFGEGPCVTPWVRPVSVSSAFTPGSFVLRRGSTVSIMSGPHDYPRNTK